jgi:hypothetical protein
MELALVIAQKIQGADQLGQINTEFIGFLDSTAVRVLFYPEHFSPTTEATAKKS